LLDDREGSGSVSLTNGYGRPKNILILRIRISNTDFHKYELYRINWGKKVEPCTDVRPGKEKGSEPVRGRLVGLLLLQALQLLLLLPLLLVVRSAVQIQG
jgi:hypothetical protein